MVVDEMHGAAADLCTVLQDRFVYVVTVEPVSAKSRDQRRMNVYHAVREVGRHGDEFQESAHDNQVDLSLAAGCENRFAKRRVVRKRLALKYTEQ